MSTQDILAELPRLSPDERELVAKALRDLAAAGKTAGTQFAGKTRQADLHAGAWKVAADFDAALPEGFWLGEDA